MLNENITSVDVNYNSHFYNGTLFSYVPAVWKCAEVSVITFCRSLCTHSILH